MIPFLPPSPTGAPRIPAAWVPWLNLALAVAASTAAVAGTVLGVHALLSVMAGTISLALLWLLANSPGWREAPAVPVEVPPMALIPGFGPKTPRADGAPKPIDTSAIPTEAPTAPPAAPADPSDLAAEVASLQATVTALLAEKKTAKKATPAKKKGGK